MKTVDICSRDPVLHSALEPCLRANEADRHGGSYRQRIPLDINQLELENLEEPIEHLSNFAIEWTMKR
jgi:hypothetical protein